MINTTATEETSVSGVDEWKKCAINIINELKSHKFADRVFSVLQPNDSGANQIILRSTDISIIRKNLENGTLKSNTELHHALHHLFLNSVMSLVSDSEVSKTILTISRQYLFRIRLGYILKQGRRL